MCALCLVWVYIYIYSSIFLFANLLSFVNFHFGIRHSKIRPNQKIFAIASIFVLLVLDANNSFGWFYILLYYLDLFGRSICHSI